MALTPRSLFCTGYGAHLEVVVGGGDGVDGPVDGLLLVQGDGAGQVGEERGEEVTQYRHDDSGRGELLVAAHVVLSRHGDLHTDTSGWQTVR